MHLFAMPNPRVYSYTRWSTPEQSRGDSLRRQTEAAERWASKHGYELDLALNISDAGVSAYRGGNALDGGLSRFLEACKQGLIEEGSILLVESLDRISRMAPRKAQRLIDDIVDSGVTIVTLNDDQYYTADRLDNDPTALLISLMVAWRAHEESKTKGRRVAEAWLEKRKRLRADPSQRLTSRGPSWLIATQDGGWMEDAGKVATIQRIYALTLSGEGEHKIAARLNAERVPVLGKGKLAGKRWHRSTVAKVLRSPAVIGALVPGRIEYVDGKRTHIKEDPVQNAFPAVISEADWLAVRALKDGKAHAPRGRHAGRGVAHMLAGLARCPDCGAAMTRVSKGSKGKAGLPKLVCTAAKTKAGCRYVSVRVQDVEEAFRTGWGNLFADIPAGDAGGNLDERVAGLEASIDVRVEHHRKLSEAFDRQPSSAYSRAIENVEVELRTIRAELDHVEELRRLTDRGLIHARIDDLAQLLDPDPSEENPRSQVDRQAINAALKVLFDGVVVDYTTGRLRFMWRQGGESSIVYAWWMSSRQS
jgi:DNA invertase Pin-like site-specific DNA recombinase